MNLNDFIRTFSVYDNSKIIFLGLGNNYRGDDGAGLYFLKKLKSSGAFKDSIYIEAGINPENYIAQILKLAPSILIFIDSAKWGGEPGNIKLFRSSETGGLSVSTHSYSLKILEEYFLQFNHIDFYYVGIQPFTTLSVKGLSAYVAGGIDKFFQSYEKVS
jgi:hydrogenase 3 maturation protease